MYDITTPVNEYMQPIIRDFTEYYNNNSAVLSYNKDEVDNIIKEIQDGKVIPVKTYEELAMLIIGISDIFIPLLNNKQYKEAQQLTQYVVQYPPKILILIFAMLLYIGGMKEFLVSTKEWLNFCKEYHKFIL